MNVKNINQYQSFGAQIVLKGRYKKNIAGGVKIMLSDPVFPKSVHGKWHAESLMTKVGVFKYLRLVSTGESDSIALSKYKSNLKIPRSGLVTVEEFNAYAKGIPVISARKALKAMNKNKFDFDNLIIKE